MLGAKILRTSGSTPGTVEAPADVFDGVTQLENDVVVHDAPQTAPRTVEGRGGRVRLGPAATKRGTKTKGFWNLTCPGLVLGLELECRILVCMGFLLGP